MGRLVAVLRHCWDTCRFMPRRHAALLCYRHASPLLLPAVYCYPDGRFLVLAVCAGQDDGYAATPCLPCHTVSNLLVPSACRLRNIACLLQPPATVPPLAFGRPSILWLHLLPLTWRPVLYNAYGIYLRFLLYHYGWDGITCCRPIPSAVSHWTAVPPAVPPAAYGKHCLPCLQHGQHGKAHISAKQTPAGNRRTGCLQGSGVCFLRVRYWPNNMTSCFALYCVAMTQQRGTNAVWPAILALSACFFLRLLQRPLRAMATLWMVL